MNRSRDIYETLNRASYDVLARSQGAVQEELLTPEEIDAIYDDCIADSNYEYSDALYEGKLEAIGRLGATALEYGGKLIKRVPGLGKVGGKLENAGKIRELKPAFLTPQEGRASKLVNYLDNLSGGKMLGSPGDRNIAGKLLDWHNAKLKANFNKDLTDFRIPYGQQTTKVKMVGGKLVKTADKEAKGLQVVGHAQTTKLQKAIGIGGLWGGANVALDATVGKDTNPLNPQPPANTVPQGQNGTNLSRDDQSDFARRQKNLGINYRY